MEDLPGWLGAVGIVYHCSTGSSTWATLPFRTQPENIVHFFRDVHGVGAITKEVLRQRTHQYNQWVELLPESWDRQEWAEKGVRKRLRAPLVLRRMERQHRFGVYFILKTLEVGSSFRFCDAEVLPPPIPTIASSAASARVTPITISTIATRCWDPSRYE